MRSDSNPDLRHELRLNTDALIQRGVQQAASARPYPAEPPREPTHGSGRRAANASAP
jgi:hypothetical protein